MDTLSKLNRSDWHSHLLQNRQWLRSIILGRVRNGSVADELLSDLFSDALNWNSSEPIAQPQNWLYRLAVRKVLQFYRRQGVEKRFESTYQELQQAKQAETRFQNPLEIVLGKERQQQIRKALSELNRKEIDVLVLKYVHQWNYQQIGEALGVSKNAVANRLRKARNNLRSQLSVQDVDL